jgi:hypothetical protein
LRWRWATPTDFHNPAQQGPMIMFERSEVWERAEDCIWVYVIFRVLRSDLFHLQQANALYADSERSSRFPTAIAAVEHHKAEFADMLSQSNELGSAVQHFPDR